MRLVGIQQRIDLLGLRPLVLREIADILGISESNVATKISRIKLILKKQFSNL